MKKLEKILVKLGFIPAGYEEVALEAGVVEVLSDVYTSFAGGGGAAGLTGLGQLGPQLLDPVVGAVELDAQRARRDARAVSEPPKGRRSDTCASRGVDIVRGLEG